MGKRIGYLRFNNSIELDFMSSSVKLRGTEVRLGVLEAMIENGHNVEILTKVRKEDTHLLEGQQQDTFGAFKEEPDEKEIDYDFLSKIDYDPRKRELDDIDVLFIESGPPNTLFSYKSDIPDYRMKFGKATPFIWRVFDLIDNFEGHVMYFQHDLKLGFPFHEATREPTPGVAEVNLTKMGSQVDFFENKEWTMVSNCLNPSAVDEYYSEYTRFSYDEYDFNWTIIPSAYSENVDLRFEPRDDNLKYDLIYVGAGDRSSYRREKIKKFYQHEEYDVGIVGGKWDEYEEDYMYYHGYVGDHGDVYEIQNWGMATVILGCELFEDAEMMASRIATTVRGGNIVMMDEDLATGYYVDEEWHVSSKEDVKENIEYLKSLDYEERRQINLDQQKKINKWVDYDWESVFEVHDEDIIVETK